MKILLACEFYHPSRGGVQEVIRQIAERLVKRGHDVTVATSSMKERHFTEWNGVKIQSFTISGNLAFGMQGEVGAYREFVKNFCGDALLVKAVQQWSFDALLEVLPEIKMRKLLVPCGFAGIERAEYADYYRRLPALLEHFDTLIAYGEECRDVTQLQEWKLPPPAIVPNGADETEFEHGDAADFRRLMHIDEDDFLMLTVGSLTGVKGHLEVVQAFHKLPANHPPTTLIVNGNLPEITILGPKGRGLRGVASWLKQRALLAHLYFYKAISGIQPGKRIVICDLPRDRLIQAFFASDLFIFASRTEYSPLVLFESAAAGTPFLSVPVGNAAEIARWTQAGVICPALKDSHGQTRTTPQQLATHMIEMANDKARLNSMGPLGRTAWEAHFNWKVIVGQYEELLRGNAQG